MTGDQAYWAGIGPNESDAKECACMWDCGYFMPCCGAHEQQYIAYLDGRELAERLKREAAGPEVTK